MGGFSTTTMVFAALALLGRASGVPISGFENVHSEMEANEVRRTFRSTPDTIPKYEVVSLQWPRLHRRTSGSGTRIRLNAFEKDVYLWLHPTEGTLVAYDTPVYYARSSASSKLGLTITALRDPMKIVGRMLEDKEKQATLMVRSSDDGRSYISGNVGSEGWTLRPLPDRFNERIYFGRFKRSSNLLTNETFVGEYHEPALHVIYKNSPLPDQPEHIEIPMEEHILRNMSGRSKRDAPVDIIYPQILVVIDYLTFKIHDEDIYGLLEYLLPFWNSVDLRYRGFEFPKFRLNIAGFLVAKDENALPFVTKNMKSSNTLDIFGALSDFGEFVPALVATYDIAKFDIGVTMAPCIMCSPQENGACKDGTLGLAYLTGACSVRHNPKTKSLSVAVIQDKGAFDGIHTATHELGHLFGATHDGAAESLCQAGAGYIMATTPVLTENSADWSRCSVDAFDKYINSGDTTCLYDKPETSSALPRVLPGVIMSMDEQCEKLEGTKWCSVATTTNPCMRLKCFWKKDPSYCTEAGDAAPDGSRCDEKKICVHGKCLSEAEIV